MLIFYQKMIWIFDLFIYGQNPMTWLILENAREIIAFFVFPVKSWKGGTGMLKQGIII